MKRFFIYALLFAAAFSLDSCREKSQVDELKDFIEEVKDKGSSYTEAQWEEANKKFSALLDKAKDAKDLSEDELREIARLQGEYASAAFKEHAGKVIEACDQHYRHRQFRRHPLSGHRRLRGRTEVRRQAEGQVTPTP